MGNPFDFGTSADSGNTPATNSLDRIANLYWDQTDPMRQSMMAKYQDFLSGNWSPEQDPSYAPLYAMGRQGIEDQYNVAKENTIGQTARGGELTSALGEIERARAGEITGMQNKLASGIATDIGNKAYGSAWGAPAQAMQGMGVAGQQQTALEQQSMANASDQKGRHITGNYQMASQCCFIFLAAEGGLDPVVRLYRDEHMTTRNRRGYCWLADRLVPTMRKHKIVHELTKFFMTRPMTCYGGYHYGQNRIGIIFAPITAAWLGLFSLLGRRGPYMRSDGEVV